ncbi:MAG TPA: hypothetical protein VKY15_04525 [Acidimicrobiales bacterium]|nr:hypothetical protein [Acidimicrobiales bacterium]
MALALALLAVGAVAGEAHALTCPPGTTAGSGGCTIGVGSLPGISLPGQQPDVQPTPSPSPSPTLEPPPPGEVAGIGLEQVQWWVLSSAGHELQQLRPVVTQPTLAPGDWFRPLYGRMTAIAVWLLGLFLLLAVLQALVRGDLSLLGEAVLKHLPAAVLATAGVVSFTLLLMRVTDDLCGFVLGALGDQVWQTLTDAAEVALAAATNPGWWGFLATLLGVLGLLSVITISLELLARMALIYLAMLFLPLGFAAMVWPAARGLVRRLLELLVGLVVSKLVLVVVLVMAGVAFAAGVPVLPDQHPAQGEPAIADLLMGVILLLIGAMSPWALVRLIPLVEVAASERFHQALANRHPMLTSPQVWRQDLSLWREVLRRWNGRVTRRDADLGGGDHGDNPAPPAPGGGRTGPQAMVSMVASLAELGQAGVAAGPVGAAATGVRAAVRAGSAAVESAAEPLRGRSGLELGRRPSTLPPSVGETALASGAGMAPRMRPTILLPGEQRHPLEPGLPGEILLPGGRAHVVAPLATRPARAGEAPPTVPRTTLPLRPVPMSDELLDPLTPPGGGG